MAHLDLAIFAHSSLQKCSKSVRLQGHLLCIALFRSPHRFSVGFRSGLWLGHSKTSIYFWRSHSFVDLDVCFGLLLCWKMKFLFIFSFLAEAWRFCANIDWYLELFIIHPVLGNITVAPYFLQLMMTVFTVFHGMSNALEIILYPSPDWYLLTMRSLWCFGSSLQTMAFAVRCD